MPELPEVEIVCRGLSQMLAPGARIKSWIFFRGDLRFKIPKTALHSLENLPLKSIHRRAKYILFQFGDQVLISHLGMTGAWRREKLNWVAGKHDHLAFITQDESVFVYSDPRRFGFVEVLMEQKLEERFSELGVEPLNSETDFKKLTEKFKSLNSPVKTALMNQKFLVGVGNIYASEALFLARISPLKSCSKITHAQYHNIWKEIKNLLNRAIEKGGSTIENYRNSFGEKGDFQSEFFVYGRAGLPCRRCKKTIKVKVQAGRSSFWCSGCQK